MGHTSRRPAIASLPVRFGAAAWIVGAAQFFLCHVVVERAWTPPYSWARNNISDLGNARCGTWGDNGRYVCSPLHAWINASFVLEGILIIVGLILTRSAWDGAITPRPARVLLCLAGAGWITAGLVPADVDENLHVLGAIAVFFGGNGGLILAGLLSRTAGCGRFRAYSVLVGTTGLIAAALFLRQQYLGLGMGGMERVAVFTVQLWTVLTGCLLLIKAFEGGAQPVRTPASDRGWGNTPRHHAVRWPPSADTARVVSCAHDDALARGHLEPKDHISL